MGVLGGCYLVGMSCFECVIWLWVAVRVFFWVVIGGLCCAYLLLASDMGGWLLHSCY